MYLMLYATLSKVAIENLNSPFLEWLAGYPILTPALISMTDQSSHISQAKSLMSFHSSAIYGNKKILYPDGGLSSHLPIHSILHLISGHA